MPLQTKHLVVLNQLKDIERLRVKTQMGETTQVQSCKWTHFGDTASDIIVYDLVKCQERAISNEI